MSQTNDWVAVLDQARRGLTDVAVVIRGYYEDLVHEGFTPAEAFALAGRAQSDLMGCGNTGGGDES